MPLRAEAYSLSSMHVVVPFVDGAVPAIPIHVQYVHYDRVPGDGPEPTFIPADRLVYQYAGGTASFEGSQIARVELEGLLTTALTVELDGKSDWGPTFFTLLLPSPRNVGDAVFPISTFGFRTHISGPDTIPHPTQSATYAPVSLTGTFIVTEGVVPDSEPAAAGQD